MAKTKSKNSSNKKFASMKRMISLKDARIKHDQRQKKPKKIDKSKITIRDAPQTSSALFFTYNTQLGPPYRILLDTNFIHFSVKNKVDIMTGLMDCLYAKCIPYVTDCVMGELEKLGVKYRVALKVIKDSRFEHLTCLHKGTYADDCLVQHVTQHKCYIVGTCDKDLKRRIRKIPGVPIMFLRKKGSKVMERNEEKDQVEDRVLESRRSKRQGNVVSYTPKKKHKVVDKPFLESVESFVKKKST